MVLFMINAIVGAPLWVWAILGYLLFVGVKAMRAQFIYLPKIFILPVVFVILNFKTIVSSELMVKDCNISVERRNSWLCCGRYGPYKNYKEYQLYKGSRQLFYCCYIAFILYHEIHFWLSTSGAAINRYTIFIS